MTDLMQSIRKTLATAKLPIENLDATTDAILAIIAAEKPKTRKKRS